MQRNTDQKPAQPSSTQGPSSERPFAPQPPAVTLPKGGGAIRSIGEKFAANPVTGTASMAVPIATSPGRSGFGPQLSLSYDSGAGNGPFGFGWTLSAPSITRKTDKGLPRYDDAAGSDVFVLSGGEDLVPLYRQDHDGSWIAAHAGHTRDADGAWVRDANGALVIHEDAIGGYRVRRYRPRIEGLFARIERWTKIDTPSDVHWRSIASDNVLSVYGSTDESRISDPADASHIFTWLICETRDDRGNAVVYDYKSEDGESLDLGQAHERNRGNAVSASRKVNRYLKRIRYGNRATLLDNAGDRPRLLQPAQIANADWMFEAVFDYGDHDAAAPGARDDSAKTPAGALKFPWPPRPDPFSSYRSGFEVRTARLCRRVLMFHHFPGDAYVGRDCLVRSTRLHYSDQINPNDARNPVYAFLMSVTVSGHRRTNAGYDERDLPPLEFDYSKPTIGNVIEEIDQESAENLPAGLDGAIYRWTDLHGEGTFGILTEQAGAWYYRRNLSPLPKVLPDGSEHIAVRLGPLELVASKPNASLAGGAELMDLAGDGQPDLVRMEGTPAGLYEHDDGDGWQPFRAFTAHPIRDLSDANLKFVDLDGDGHADLLISEDDALVWHESRGEEGFGEARRVVPDLDEEKGPRVIFADGTESIFLADLNGDGLTDIVRIRNGSVCYWANLGFGRFGAKVSMDQPPLFDDVDQFDPKRIRLADIDGSGTTDIIYLHRAGVRLYFNQSGNSWSKVEALAMFPPIDGLAHIQPVDLLGDGTACLAWSSSLPGAARRPLRYVRLMSTGKPHLMIRITNNLGADTTVRYASSNKFYLQDIRDGRPWITRLPFPVHVVERVETFDHISRNRFASRYAYHHGYFDGGEREFRGFGMVEQWDTEEFSALSSLGAAANVAADAHVPPVRIKSWYHTGVYVGRHGVSRQFEHEYFREPGLTIDTARPLLLNDTELPALLSAEVEREACRALKGSLLRREVYAEDAGPLSPADRITRARTPYTVSEQNYTVRVMQPRGDNAHAVFFAQAREALTFHYERNAADPRLQHSLTLEVDDYGNTLKEAAIGYGRRTMLREVDADGNVRQESNAALDALEDFDAVKQRTPLVTYIEHRVTGAVSAVDSYRVPLPCETRTFELTRYTASGEDGRFQPADFVEADPNQPGRLRHQFGGEDSYEDVPAGPRRRRLIDALRTLYRRDDLTGFLPLGQLQSRALPFESYKLAFTAGLITTAFERPVAGQPPSVEALIPNPVGVLDGQGGDRGGYVQTQTLKADGRFPATDIDGDWWIPSGRTFFTTNAAANAAAEVTEARAHFFLPRRQRDPFGHDTTVAFDADDLLIAETRDPLGNRVTAAVNDYRVLQPRIVSDPNGNRSAVAFDVLGLVTGTAVMGKPLPAPQEGDRLDTFDADLTQAQIDAFIDAADPRGQAAALLDTATTRIVYDLHRFRRTRLANPNDRSKWLPSCAATLSRETHHLSALPPHGLRIQCAFAYSDGYGREIQKKTQAEQGPLVPGGANVDPRWVGSGWTIFNNKGKPVRQYEPFFSATHGFEFGAASGVSPVLFYDPAERVIATINPNHTFQKVVFDSWQQTTYDVNDTCAPRGLVTGDPRTDLDIAGFVDRYFAAQPAGWQTWHAQRITGGRGVDERNAAERAATHADTPTTIHFDVLGRTFLTVARNRVVCAGHDLDGSSAQVTARIDFDIEGLERSVRDGIDQAGDRRGRLVMLYDYDLTGNRIRQASMEAGTRWTLSDVAGKSIRSWDSRGHNWATRYDALRRQIEQRVRGTSAASDPRTSNAGLLIDRIEYGESLANANAAGEAVARTLNVRTRIYRQFDAAGVVTNARLDGAGNAVAAFDYKGNLLHLTRRLTNQYDAIPNWQLNPALENETFTSSTRYDALNRPIQSTAPHSDAAHATRHVIQPGFNEANLLERVDVWLQRPGDPAGLLDPSVDLPSAVGVAGVDYDAKGQRLRIVYRNGVMTRYEYDADTFRMVRMYSRRGPAFNADSDNPNPPPLQIASPDTPPVGADGGVQNLRYTYDPGGRITHIEDDAQQRIYFNNKRVEPSNDYVYDALYRLIQSTGREHLGQGVPEPHTCDDANRVGLQHPGDGNAMGTYTERYVYDLVGNVVQMQHRGSDPAHAGWTRHYTYGEASLLEDSTSGLAKTSNRLTRTTLNRAAAVPQDEPYLHDAHGNVVRMPHLGDGDQAPNMHWDFRDQLHQADLGGGGTAYYTYDSGGQRTRNIWEKNPGRIEERIYLGAFEIFREHGGPIGPNTAALERETLHVSDGTRRIALVEMRTIGNDAALQRSIRYQLGNHLGSTTLELDHQAEIVSYEEYSPYGSTTYQAVRSQTETTKRYRYTDKERDDETGFFYHGARYYAPWIARWVSCDPAALRDGPNLYQYSHSSPINVKDPTGLAGEDDFSELNNVVDDLQKGELKVDLVDKRPPLQPASEPMSKTEARKHGNKQAAAHRKASGMNQGATVQAGHTAAARHAPESGISKEDWDKQPMQELHSRKNQGLDVKVTDQAGNEATRTRHTSQEGLIDDAVERSKAANGGKLTPQGQLDAAAEVKWRTENVPMDQRDVEKVRKGASFAPEKAPPVDVKTTKVIKAGEEALEKGGKTVLKKLGTKALKVVPFVGIGASLYSAKAEAAQGNYGTAALEVVGMVPVVGDVVDAGRLGVAIGEVASEALGIDAVAAEHGEGVEKAARFIGLGQDSARLVGATGAALSSITVAPTIALQRTVMGWFK